MRLQVPAFSYALQVSIFIRCHLNIIPTSLQDVTRERRLIGPTPVSHGPHALLGRYGESSSRHPLGMRRASRVTETQGGKNCLEPQHERWRGDATG